MALRHEVFDLHRYGLEELIERRGAKWSRIAPGGVGAGLADMDFPIAPVISEALFSAIERDDLGYPDESLIEAVRVAFSRRYAERHGTAVDPELVVVTTDVVQSIYAALLTLTEPGAGVLFFTPAYPPFFEAVAATGRREIACDLVAGPHGYEIDFDHLKALLDSSAPSCLLLCNPHNPTGRAFRRDELTELAALACERELVVLSDEIHADLALPGATHLPIAGLGADIARRTVTLSSASKAFNIAGLRCAVAAFGDGALRARFGTLPGAVLGQVGVPGLLAACAAWEFGDSWLETVIAELTANRSVVVDCLGSLDGVGLRSPEATYLAWLDLSACGLGDDPAKPIERLTGVALSSGSYFGSAGRGHARLNFGTNRRVLEQLCERVAAVVGGAR